MRELPHRPALRPVETLVVPDARHGRVLVLRDPQGIAPGQAVVPPELVPIVGLFDGRLTLAEIADAASRELGSRVPVELVRTLVAELDEALLLQSPRFERARADAVSTFRQAPVRTAAHAGGAYHGDPVALQAYLETECLAPARRTRAPRAAGSEGPRRTKGRGGRRAVGLIAPHIDPWRGARCYGHAYEALARALPPEADTFVLLGTSHAPMREPFALCRKAFHTPLGTLPADTEAIDALAKAASFDPFADEMNHKREHSLEFQAVFLAHLLGARGAASSRRGNPRIVPILAGLGRHQACGDDPARDGNVAAFVEGLRALAAERPGRVVLVAGADLAHVGPRFGDAAPYDDAQRRALEARDRASLACAEERNQTAFWAHVAADLETRRVCGLAPVYTLLAALPADARGELLHYEQTVDPEEGSIVSHAAMVFHTDDP